MVPVRNTLKKTLTKKELIQGGFTNTQCHITVYLFKVLASIVHIFVLDTSECDGIRHAVNHYCTLEFVCNNPVYAAAFFAATCQVQTSLIAHLAACVVPAPLWPTPRALLFFQYLVKEELMSHW